MSREDRILIYLLSVGFVLIVMYATLVERQPG